MKYISSKLNNYDRIPISNSFKHKSSFKKKKSTTKIVKCKLAN